MGKKAKPDDAFTRSMATLKVAFIAGIVILAVLGAPVLLAAFIEGGK